MIKKYREFLLAKDKKALIYLASLAVVGVFLLVLGSGAFFNPPSEGGAGIASAYGDTSGAASGDILSGLPDEGESVPASGGTLFNRERELEKRLEEAFALMENVGKVRVLVSLSPDRETVYAKDVGQQESVSRETDSQGGSRETRDQQRQEETIMFTDSTGTDRPLVLREIERKIEGAVIIAEGGDSVFVQDALTKAACTILGVEANKVQVLKMKI